VDVRFTTLELRDLFDKQLRSWSRRKDIDICFKIVDDCPPLENVFGEAILDNMKAKLSTSEKKDMLFKHYEGASDANYFSHPENDGLGARGNNFHSRKEFIEESSLARRSMALSKFLMNLPQLYSQHESLIANTKTA
jgi:acetylornithine deacetylase/succinyl-diaminopimelate desuccinylase-like protein